MSCARATTWTAREIRRRRKRTAVNESTGSATTPPPPPPVVSRARVPDRDSRTAATALVAGHATSDSPPARPYTPPPQRYPLSAAVIMTLWPPPTRRDRTSTVVIRQTLSHELVIFLSLADLTVFRVRTFGSTTGVAIVRTRPLRATVRFTSVVSVTSRVNIMYTPLR